MKRIISLIMSVLMIATMFCGFATTSTAVEAPAVINVVAEDNGDGTYKVSWYMMDNSDFGWHMVSFDCIWDENIVAEETEMLGGTGIVNIWKLNRYFAAKQSIFEVVTDDLTSKTVSDGTKKVGNNIIGLKDMAIAKDAAFQRIAFQTKSAGFQWPMTPEYAEILGLNMADYNYSNEYGFLMGWVNVSLKDGATSGVVSATPQVFNIAKDDATGAYETVTSNIVVNSVTIEAAAPETPALPAGITLDVQTAVQARTNDPAGLRFTTVATATDWSVIDEMGTAIVVAGTTPGTDTTLKVPARVDWDGDYLQAYTKVDGKYDFEDGITTNKASVTYTGVISNIKEANKDVDFQAYAYVIVDGVTYYSATSATASYNDIFVAAQNDPTIA